MKLVIGVVALLALARVRAAPAAAAGFEKVVEQFMGLHEGMEQHDLGDHRAGFLSPSPTVEEQTASLERGFVLRGQGYHHSDIFEIKAA